MGRRIVQVALLSFVAWSSFTWAWGAIRIDGSSDEAANRTFQRMMKSLKPDQQQALVIALLQINFIGVESVTEAARSADLQNPSAARVKDKIAGMTAPEIIAFSKNNATTTAFVEGEEPGVPQELLRPLAGGPPSTNLADTTWTIEDTINGHIKRDVYQLHADHTMTLIESDKKQGGTCRWEQAGEEVRLSFSDGHSVNLGRFTDPSTMKGEGGNKNGFRWTWTAAKR
jgi:hypothetical protein